MSARKAKRQPTTQPTKSRQWFYTGPCSISVGDTEEPLPCPFCGDNEMVCIEIEDGEDGKRAHAACETCGCRAPGAFAEKGDAKSTMQLVQEAARDWNTRRSAKAVQS